MDEVPVRADETADAVENATDPAAAKLAARERPRALTEAFYTDLNKASTTEHGEFRPEFLA
jgi:hypothetical protein